jgi:hypothetical protein
MRGRPLQSSAVALIIACAVILDVSAEPAVFGLSAWVGRRTATLAGALLLCLAAGWLLVARRAAEPPSTTIAGETRWNWDDAWPLLAGGLLLSKWSGRGLPRGAEFLFLALVAATIAAPRFGRSLVAALAFGLGVVMRADGFRRIPVDPRVADMLPLVDAALTRFLSGKNPYGTYAMPWTLPLTYLPVTWLAYLPARAAGIDLRWTHVAASAVVLGAALYAARGRNAGRAYTAWAGLFLMPASVHWDCITAASVSWATIAWAVALLARESRMAWLGVGIALATSPLAWLLVPLGAGTWWKAGGRRQVLLNGAAALVTAAVIVLPFAMQRPDDFLYGTMIWFNALDGFPKMKWNTARSWADHAGFAGVFWAHGREHWLRWIQGLVVLGVSLDFSRRGASSHALPASMAGMVLLFVLFNPVLWPYLHHLSLIAGLVAVASGDR